MIHRSSKDDHRQQSNSLGIAFGNQLKPFEIFSSPARLLKNFAQGARRKGLAGAVIMHRDHAPVRVDKDKATMRTALRKTITVESTNELASSNVLDGWRVGHERAMFTAMCGSSATMHP